MRSDAITLTFTRKLRHTLRGEIYGLVLSGRRVVLLARVVAALVFSGFFFEACQTTCKTTCRTGASTTVTSPWLFLPLAVAAIWLVWPVLRDAKATARREARRATKATVHGEGFVVEGPSGSLAVAWNMVRAVRPTAEGVAFVLDASCMEVPGVAAPSVEAIVGAFEQSRAPSISRGADATEDAEGRARARPYRTAEEMVPLEDAAPEEWQPAPGYPHRALVFATTRDLVASSFPVRRKPTLVFAGLGTATLIAMWIAAVHSVVATSFHWVAGFFGILAVSHGSIALARSLVTLRDRFVAERRHGILYAAGGAGLYMRTHHFERREPWDDVRSLHESRSRVRVETASGVHVIPTAAFAKDEDRAAFVRVVRREIEARRPPTTPAT